MTETEYIRAMNRITDATFSTTCARCAAPLEVTDDTIDAVSKAHEASCFVPGDLVHGEWDHGWHVTLEGTVLCVGPINDNGLLPIDIEVTKSNTFTPGPRGLLLERGDLRRITRPEPVVAPDSETSRQTFAPGDIAEWRLDGLTWERVTVVRAYPDDKFEIEHHRTVERWQVHRSAMRRISRPEPVDPLDVEYDGTTLRELLVCDEIQRRGECTPHVRFTPVQRAAVSAHWSAELRARVNSSKERERLTVVNEHDCEDEPWR